MTPFPAALASGLSGLWALLEGLRFLRGVTPHTCVRALPALSQAFWQARYLALHSNCRSQRY